MTRARADSVANITVEAGNFAPQSKSRTDSIKVRATTDFYRDLHYDAVGLSSREIGFGIGMWENAAKDGVPVIAANVCKDQRGKKPVFKPYIIKEDHGDRFGIIGFVSSDAWKAYSDTTRKLYLKSPFEMGKLIRKVAKKCDHLTVIGEFTTKDADSLIRMFPEINVVVSSGIKSDQVTKVGNSLIVGSSTRGNYGSYVDWTYAPADTALHYVNMQQVLDPTVPEDTMVVRLLSKMNETIKAPPDKH